MTYQWLPISLHEVSIWVSIFQCVAALYSVCVCMYVCYVCMYVYSAVCVYGQVRSQHFYSEVSMYLRSGCKEAEKATWRTSVYISRESPPPSSKRAPQPF